MAILLKCPCGRKLKIREEFAGQEGQCPACGATLMIPYPDDVPEVALAEPSPVAGASELEPEQRSDQEIARLPRREERAEKICNHGGGELPVNGDYFVEAPAEIGPLLSGYTTLRKGQRPWSIPARTIVCVLATFGGLFVGAGIDLVFDVGGFWAIVWPIVFPAGAFLLALYLTSFTHTVTYVGQEGVARYLCSGTRDNLGCREVFLFRDATHLRTSTTHHYNRGSYQYTTYKYTWTDVGGRQRYQISGSHTKKDGNPPSTDYYHFARAAEFAWTMYLIDDAHRQIELSGGVKFHVGRNQWIRVGPGKLTFALGGVEDEWDAHDVGAATVHQGVVKIKRTDAKEGWFSSSGVIKFPFENLANAQLFFHLLDKLLGVQVE